ncbi:MAG: right-handed parallel beta-helix repeat-containing protein [Trueperaceae bacterium]
MTTSMTRIHATRTALTLAATFLFATAAAGFAQSEHTVTVDCAAGDDLAAALAEAAPGTTLALAGTCDGPVTIAVDGVTLDGGGDAVIRVPEDASGPVVHVDGVRDARLIGLTVENGQHGILAERMASLELRNVVSRGNGAHGVEVINSFVEADDLHAHDNGRVGVNVNRSGEARLRHAVLEDNGISGLISFNGAIVRLEERNVIRGNGAQGFTLGMNGMLFTIGAELVVEGNGAEGIYLQQSGHAQFLGGDVQVRGNGGDGVAADFGSTLALGIDAFQVPGAVTIEGNGRHGLSVSRGSIVAVESVMPVHASGNAGAGLHVSDGAQASVAESTFAGNDGGGVVVAFGGQLTVSGGENDGVACDGTVQVRGDASCL